MSIASRHVITRIGEDCIHQVHENKGIIRPSDWFKEACHRISLGDELRAPTSACAMGAAHNVRDPTAR
jgi:hypothetical protein